MFPWRVARQKGKPKWKVKVGEKKTAEEVRPAENQGKRDDRFGAIRCRNMRQSEGSKVKRN